MFQLPDAQLFFYSRKKLVKKNVRDIVKGKNVLIIMLPGAFTPTCSASMVPGYEKNYEKFKEFDIDEIHVLSMNDPYVMDAWWKSMKIKKLKYMPDGNGALSLRINKNDGIANGDCVVEKYNKGMYKRNWRCVLLVQDGICIWSVAEEGPENGKNNCVEDPYIETTPEAVLAALKARDVSDRVKQVNNESNNLLIGGADLGSSGKLGEHNRPIQKPATINELMKEAQKDSTIPVGTVGSSG